MIKSLVKEMFARLRYLLIKTYTLNVDQLKKTEIKYMKGIANKQ